MACRPCTNFLAFFAPSVNPASFAAGDGASGYADNLAHVGDIHGFQNLAFGVVDAVVGIVLCHEEVIAPTFEFPYTAAGESANLFAALVIDVVPVLCLLDIRYLLTLRLNSKSQHKKHDGEKFSHKAIPIKVFTVDFLYFTYKYSYLAR